jgi:hypothetical protein
MTTNVLVTFYSTYGHVHRMAVPVGNLRSENIGDAVRSDGEVTGWELDASAKAKIDRILKATSAMPSAPNSWRRGRAAPRRHKRADIANN